MDRKIKGISLIELLIVIALIAVLAALATPPLLKWRQAYYIESDVKQLASVLQNARMKAFSEKIDLSANLNGNSVCVLCDTNSTDNTACTNKYNSNCIISYQLKFNYGNYSIPITKRGVFSTNITIKYPGSNPASYDCLVISNLRTKLEKCNGQ